MKMFSADFALASFSGVFLLRTWCTVGLFSWTGLRHLKSFRRMFSMEKGKNGFSGCSCGVVRLGESLTFLAVMLAFCGQPARSLILTSCPCRFLVDLPTALP